MKDLVEYVTVVLKPLNIPVVFQSLPSGSKIPPQYITFLEYTANPSLEAADKEIETERLIQVNIWSNTNYHSLVNRTRSLLEEAGFQRTTEYDGPYTEGDSHFNKVLRFAFFDDY